MKRIWMNVHTLRLYFGTVRDLEKNTEWWDELSNYVDVTDQVRQTLLGDDDEKA